MLCNLRKKLFEFCMFTADVHEHCAVCLFVYFSVVMGIVFNAPLSTIFQLVEETGVPRDNHRPAASHWQILSHNVVSSTLRPSGIRTNNISCLLLNVTQIYT